MSKNDWMVPVLAIGGLAAAALYIFPDTIRWILFKEQSPPPVGAYAVDLRNLPYDPNNYYLPPRDTSILP